MAAFPKDKVIEDCGYDQWFFTLPRMLRPFGTPPPESFLGEGPARG